jgi:hypothetical protein
MKTDLTPDQYLQYCVRRTEILAAVDAARASIARGEGIEITRESMRALTEDIKRRGRERMAAERLSAK